MTADFFRTYIIPAYDDWLADRENIRKAKTLAAELNNVVEHYWKTNHQISPNVVGNTSNIKQYRDYLALENPALGLIRDVADSHKHLFLNRASAQIKDANDVEVKSIGYGEAYGLRYGGGEIIAVTLDSGETAYFDIFAQQAYEYWECIFA